MQALLIGCLAVFYLIAVDVGISAAQAEAEAFSPAALLNEMRVLNREKNYLQAQKHFESVGADGWTVNDNALPTQAEKTPAELDNTTLLKLFSEYTFALLKQKKFKECQDVFAAATSPYCCTSAFNQEDQRLPEYKPLQFNADQCDRGWEGQYTAKRKLLRFPTCAKKRPMSFQLANGRCYYIKTGSVDNSGERQKIVEKAGINSVVLMYLEEKSQGPVRIAYGKSDRTIPSGFPTAEKVAVDLYSDEKPDRFGVLISGPTQGWDAGTARGSFQTFGILDVSKKTFRVVDEVQLGYH